MRHDLNAAGGWILGFSFHPPDRRALFGKPDATATKK
jgi:hypothetical protein